MAKKRKPALAKPQYYLREEPMGEYRLLKTGACLEIATSLGHTISVELWEREDGQVYVRGLNCGLVVKPHSSNLILISGDN